MKNVIRITFHHALFLGMISFSTHCMSITVHNDFPTHTAEIDPYLQMADAGMTKEQGSAYEYTLTDELRKALGQPHIQIKKLLGKGKQGSVYLAEGYQFQTGEATCPDYVAIKKSSLDFAIRTELRADESGYLQVSEHNPERLPENAFIHLEKLRALTHPNIVRLHDVIPDHHSLIMVMDYHPHTVWQMMKKTPEKHLSHSQTKKITVQLLHASSHLLSEGLVHKDIRPDNLLVSRNENEVIIADFDLMEQLPEETDQHTPSVNLLSGYINNLSPQTAQQFLLTGKASPFSIHAAAIAATHLELRTGISLLDAFYIPAGYETSDKVMNVISPLNHYMHDEPVLREKIAAIYRNADVSIKTHELDFIVSLMTGKPDQPLLHPYLAETIP